jgi:RNA polymerase sigma-70 factor (ECF subfamily)
VIDQLGKDSILAAIESLPPILRDVVVLADVQGASYGSIAERLEIPLGSVASRLFRARRRLQRTLGEPLERAG